MKTVFSSLADVAHVYASQTQNHGRSSNLFFEGNTLYSYGYHFAICKFDGDSLLFTIDTYSSSTSRQIRYANQATRHIEKIYVPRVLNSIAENFETWKKELHELASKLKTARKPENYIAQMDYIMSLVNKYAIFMNTSVPIELLEINQLRTKERAKSFDADKDKREKQLAEWRRESIRLANIEALKKYNEDVEKFKNFEINYIYSSPIDHYDYIRFNAEFNVFETSQRVVIPFDAGKRLFNYLHNLESGEVPNYRLLNMYNVREVTDTIVKIGCHKMLLTDINSLAEKLNF